MKEIKRICQVKDGKNYRTTYEETDEKEIYKNLSLDLINKKINQCRYIKSISRKSNYDGTQTITVNYDNNVRNIYIVRT